MDVGPFEMQTVIREGESPDEARKRLMRVMNKMAEDDFAEKLPRYLERQHEAKAKANRNY